MGQANAPRLIAALACLAFSTPDANALTAIDTTGKTATEIIQISEAAGAFAPAEPSTSAELAFRHELTGVVCRVPVGSRMWLYVGEHDRRGDSSSCFYTDDFRNTTGVSRSVGNTPTSRLKSRRHLPRPCADHLADNFWAAVTA
ncbi:MAG: hypothetical protein IPG56_05810 [Caulobacteraceae bacterium]|nr:hypothetical protein [Caulobacteraceae bacterium]